MGIINMLNVFTYGHACTIYVGSWKLKKRKRSFPASSGKIGRYFYAILCCNEQTLKLAVEVEGRSSSVPTACYLVLTRVSVYLVMGPESSTRE